MIIRHRTLAATIAVAACFALAACGGSTSPAATSSPGTSDAPSSSSSAPTAAPGGKFSVAIEQPQSLVPSNCYDLYCSNVLNAMFTGLFRFSTLPGGTVEPVHTELTKSISTADGGKTWTFEINPGWTFTNGEAITSKTFVDTWNFAALGTNGQQLGFVFGDSQLNVVGYSDVSDEKAPKAQTMSGLKIVNDTTWTMALVAPLGKGLLENFVAGPQIFPMPSVAMTDPDAFSKQPIGNGYYLMKEPWVPNQKIVIDRNPNYKGTPALADTVEFRIYNDSTAEWADLQAGNLDVEPQLPQSALATAASVLGDRYVNIPGSLGFGYYAFPQQGTAFKSKDVRIAIAKAINWDDINSKLFYGTQVRAGSFAPKTILGGGEDVCGENCVFDPAAAKAKLASGGGIAGNAIQFAALQGGPNTTSKAVCNQIQTNLGVACTLKLFPDFGTMLEAYANISASDSGFILSGGWAADNPTLQNMIGPSFTTGAANNYIGYSNKSFDALITQGNAAADPAKQVALWQQAEAVLYGDFVAYATSFYNTTYGYSTRVSNVKIDPTAYINISEIAVIAP